MNTLFRGLTKYEPQLASLWRAWLLISRLFRRDNRVTNFSSLQVAVMYWNSRKFWATNNEQFLRSSLAQYFKLRNFWITNNYMPDSARLEIQGWASKQVARELRKTYASIKMYGIFRPDVWYMNDFRGGLRQGFRMIISEDDFVEFDIKHAKSEFTFLIEKDQKDWPPGTKQFSIESIRPYYSGKSGKNWLRDFQVNPKHFTFLLEAAADFEMSNLIVSFYKRFPHLFASESMAEVIAKISLVSQSVPQLSNIHGWELKKRVSPPWTSTATGISEGHQHSEISLGFKYFEADNLEVLNGGITCQGDTFLDWDSAQSPSLDFVAGNWPYVIGSHSNLKYCFVKSVSERNFIKCGIVLSSRVDSNWFHFLIETLPRLFLIPANLDSTVPVIISGRVPKTGIQALRLITSRDITVVDENSITEIEKAYVPGPVIYHPDTQFLWGKTRKQDINFEALWLLRNRILENLWSDNEQRLTYWPRVSQYRTILNSKRIISTLSKLGFKVVNPGGLSFSQQVQSVLESRFLVADGGALMANFIFAKEGTRITVLVSKFGGAYAMPKFLGEEFGAKVSILTGTAVGFGRADTIVGKSHSSFRTSLRKLRSHTTGIIKNLPSN